MKKLADTDPEEIKGLGKCRACSGYGNCVYRKYAIIDGKPVSLCRRDQLEAKAAEAAQSSL